MTANKIAGFALILFLIGLFGYCLTNLLGMAIDYDIDSQNRMLCQSAQISDNVTWLKKCKEYYQTGNIEYLR